MESFFANKKSEAFEEKAKQIMKAVLFAVPIAFGQVEATANPEYISPETVGEPVRLSTEEWNKLKYYRDLALWGKTEVVEHYGVKQNGETVTPSGGRAALGAHGGYFDAEKTVEELSRMENVQSTTVHQHPVENTYGGLFQRLSGAYQGIEMTPEKWKNLSKEHDQVISQIRKNELFSAWPPSSIDVKTIAHHQDIAYRVVDANGVWTVKIDSSSEQGKKIAELAENAKKIEDTMNNTPEASRDGMLKYAEAVRQVSSAIPADFTEKQTLAATPTNDREKWLESIREFIEYGKQNGINMSYTLFGNDSLK